MREACSVYYSAEIPVDHITDHLPFRSTRKQWTGERRRVRLSERKGAEKAIFSGNCLHRSVWEQDAGCSSHLTPTKKTAHAAPARAVFLTLRAVSLNRTAHRSAQKTVQWTVFRESVDDTLTMNKPHWRGRKFDK